MNYKDTLSRALLILKRREHAVNELKNKLLYKGGKADIVDLVLDKCIEEGWISDQRYADHYARVKMQAGWGPLYVLYQLNKFNISSDISTPIVKDLDWVKACQNFCLRKNYKLDDNKNIKRLLLRGYSMDIINQVTLS